MYRPILVFYHAQDLIQNILDPLVELSFACYRTITDLEVIKYKGKFVYTIEVDKIYQGKAEINLDRICGYINDGRLIYDWDFYDYSAEITREMLFRNNLELIIKEKACDNYIKESFVCSIIYVKV